MKFFLRRMRTVKEQGVVVFMVYFMCWLYGHKVAGRVVEGGFRNAAGELLPGWKYYCKRCPTAEEFPDRRNLYDRTIGFLLTRHQIRRTFRKL